MKRSNLIPGLSIQGGFTNKNLPPPLPGAVSNFWGNNFLPYLLHYQMEGWRHYPMSFHPEISHHVLPGIILWGCSYRLDQHITRTTLFYCRMSGWVYSPMEHGHVRRGWNELRVSAQIFWNGYPLYIWSWPLVQHSTQIYSQTHRVLHNKHHETL